MSELETNERQAAVNRAIGNLVFLIVRGVTLKQPRNIRVHGHRDVLFIQAEFLKDGIVTEVSSEDSTETKDFMVFRCPNFTLTPASEIAQADFKGEWPPQSIIKEMESQIIVPNSAQTGQILKGK